MMRMAKSGFILPVVAGLLLSGCTEERTVDPGAATVKNGTVHTAPEKQGPFIEKVEHGQAVNGVQLPFQSLGFEVPADEALTVYGATIGYEEYHHISAFRMTEAMQLQLTEFIQAHATDGIMERIPEVSTYTDYVGSTRHEHMGTRADFFQVKDEPNADVLVRVTYKERDSAKRDVLLAMARKLILYPAEEPLQEKRLFSGTPREGDKTDLQVNGETVQATFVPFELNNYGLYIAPPMERHHFEDGTEVGMNKGREYIGLYTWEQNSSLTPYGHLVTAGGLEPRVLDQGLTHIPEYRGTKVDIAGVREDFFLYSDDVNHVFVKMRYFTKDKESVLPLFLASASTLRKY